MREHKHNSVTSNMTSEEISRVSVQFKANLLLSSSPPQYSSASTVSSSLSSAPQERLPLPITFLLFPPRVLHLLSEAFIWSCTPGPAGVGSSDTSLSTVQSCNCKTVFSADAAILPQRPKGRSSQTFLTSANPCSKLMREQEDSSPLRRRRKSHDTHHPNSPTILSPQFMPPLHL